MVIIETALISAAAYGTYKGGEAGVKATKNQIEKTQVGKQNSLLMYIVLKAADLELPESVLCILYYCIM
jgi:hypothetical protein